MTRPLLWWTCAVGCAALVSHTPALIPITLVAAWLMRPKEGQRR